MNKGVRSAMYHKLGQEGSTFAAKQRLRREKCRTRVG